MLNNKSIVYDQKPIPVSDIARRTGLWAFSMLSAGASECMRLYSLASWVWVMGSDPVSGSASDHTTCQYRGIRVSLYLHRIFCLRFYFFGPIDQPEGALEPNRG